MRVKMKVGISGGRGDGTEWPRVGGEIEVPDPEGADLCAAGLAVPVKVDDTEAAVAEEDSEKAVLTTESGPTKRGPGRPRKTT